jgi:hypothetical protein
MRRMLTRCVMWATTVALVVLVGRAIGYALSPSPDAARLAQHMAGPGLPAVAIVSLAIAATLAIGICWLAAIGVRERAALERRRLATPVRTFRVARTLARAVALMVVTSLAGGLLEAYVHWRAGLGWHGLHCLVGPVHRDLIPLYAALSLVAAAIIGAGEHVAAWMRRTFAVLRALPPQSIARAPLPAPHALFEPRALLRTWPCAARAPPAFS